MSEIPKYTLISYSRDKKRNPTGVLVAIKTGNNGEFNLGYAQCCKDDRFNKKMGIKIAIGRAEISNFNDWFFSHKVPFTIRKMLPAFIKRCEKYYKPIPITEFLSKSIT
jgi:hypothetical protein